MNPFQVIDLEKVDSEKRKMVLGAPIKPLSALRPAPPTTPNSLVWVDGARTL
jgi:hypothetical protein